MECAWCTSSKETKLKNNIKKNHSSNFVSHQGARKKGKKHVNDNRGTTMLMSPSIKYLRRKTKMVIVISLEIWTHLERWPEI